MGMNIPLSFGGALSTAVQTIAKLLGLPRVLYHSSVAIPNTGNTTENTLVTLSIPANAMGPNGFVRVTTLWTGTNNANAKTLKIKFGGTSYLSSNIASVATVQDARIIRNRDSVSSQIGGYTSYGGLSSSSGGAVTSTVDTTADVSLVITVQNANAGDTVTLESYIVEVVYKA